MPDDKYIVVREDGNRETEFVAFDKGRAVVVENARDKARVFYHKNSAHDVAFKLNHNKSNFAGTWCAIKLEG